MTLAAVFPGQGSQYLSMGLELVDRYPEVIDVFAVAEDVTDQPLAEMVSKGPKELLDETINAQPAIFTVNYLYWRILKQKGFHPDYVAGHSLGELSACLAAGVFSFEEGLRIVKRRAELMSRAALETGGGMMAVLGLDDEKVAEVAAAVGLQPANYNCPGQVVVAGPNRNLEQGGDAFKSAGAGKVVRLAVSGAFHSPAMATPARLFGDWLHPLDFHDPQIPIISNATAEPLLSADDVKAALASQLVRPVRWQACIERLAQRGVDTFIEVGPGRVLSGLIERIAPEAKVEHVADRLNV
ncbi:MAG: ACP S-malonyltransferase [Actinomycetota bacterium]|nr:ACP S-malonyltransferase [Actinomycetota bacterium]